MRPAFVSGIVTGDAVEKLARQIFLPIVSHRRRQSKGTIRTRN